MYIYVGIIENENACYRYLSNLIDQWAQSVPYDVSYDVFQSGEEIMTRNTSRYHLLFIDIQLNGMNGIHTARWLRENGYRGEIVFLTAFKDYVFEGYEVRALNYILKPIAPEKLNTCMNIILQSLENQNYIIKSHEDMIKLPYRDILYILSERHYMEFITTGGSCRQLIRIKDLMVRLPNQFVQCHRTVIVNLEHVSQLNGKQIIMSNQTSLPVSHTYLQVVRERFESLVF